jgi:hypothetical protein
MKFEDKTIGGHEVRFYAYDGGGIYKIHGAIRYGSGFVPHKWTSKGISEKAPEDCITDECELNLIEVWRPIKDDWCIFYSAWKGFIIVSDDDDNDYEKEIEFVIARFKEFATIENELSGRISEVYVTENGGRFFHAAKISSIEKLISQNSIK